MATCPNCGTEIPEGTRGCPACGAGSIARIGLTGSAGSMSSGVDIVIGRIHAGRICGEDARFMDEKQEDHMMQGIHRIFSRGVFTRDDAAIMLGVARQALWAHRNPSLEGRKPSIG